MRGPRQPSKAKLKRALPTIKVARRKLQYLHAAVTLQDLRSPPGNQLEALKGDRKGQHSIRVNEQFRICFVWTADGPDDVELTDYHS
ncbi:type II toxin-antitoxin system RelE/ParE family toxin [Bradyrhizobium sp. WSM 1704]|uniref:type II toxin-antitoxin system RelE/ParE family toxin n=1 Tax=Bradyrhizobium semiaridum TaxID=2821404 RepID=UPI00289B13C6|nr:type II toxin-antitoxin system RelE/ParE family toxin [Bradyrhizobium semiaridum]MCA6121771.1 type II toxin-antitoxin system RelE/ParE family toxin [Bradyrhizobium semiaridum]